MLQKGAGSAEGNTQDHKDGDVASQPHDRQSTRSGRRITDQLRLVVIHSSAMGGPNGVTAEAAALSERLVRVALDWEKHFGVAPSITSTLSEFDAARLVGMGEDSYCEQGKLRTSVTPDTDFCWRGIRCQVTANRPSGKKGSRVTLVKQKTEKKRKFGWDRIIWILYDESYVLREAWEFTREEYRSFSSPTRLSPDDMRKGRCLAKISN